MKITGSRNLTLHAILQYANNQKGLDMIGIIDCHVPEVLLEIEQLVNLGASRRGTTISKYDLNIRL